MGFTRDAGLYLKRLIALDTAQLLIFLASLLVLVGGVFIAPPWAVVIFLGILMFSSFRLWRDEREIAEHEREQLQAIAARIRSQISAQPVTGYRDFTFAENPDDRRNHERAFRKHFPNISKTMDAWLHNPDDRATLSLFVRDEIIRQMPEEVPEAMRDSIANAILSYVENSLLNSLAPPGRFDVATEQYDGSGVESTRLRYQEGPSTWGVFSVMPNIENIDEIADSLNELSVTIWNSAAAGAWRELLRQDGRQREELRDYLTEVINKHHLTRRYCDRECYELSSGD